MPIVLDLEFIVKLRTEEAPKNLPFKELFHNRPEMASMMLLWNNNSYYINVEDRYFLINGGRRIIPAVLVLMKNPIVLYARRNKQEVNMNMDKPSEMGDRTITYLLGAEGIVDGISKEILLEVSENGLFWKWRNKR